MALEQLDCRACKRCTSHDLLKTVVQRVTDRDAWGHPALRHQILRCRGCDTHAFRTIWMHGRVVLSADVFPDLRQRHIPIPGALGLPRQVAPIYFETCKTFLAGQRILGGVGIRALVEAVCRQKRAKGRNLKARIQALAERGYLSHDQARQLQRLRLMGNRAAHSFRRVPPQELAVAMQIVEHLLQAVYILPTAMSIKSQLIAFGGVMVPRRKLKRPASMPGQ